MASRNYSSNAASTSLVNAVTDTGTSILVTATTGFPAPPFILSIDPGEVTQELVLVTGVAGTTLTVTRGYDSTSATAHNAGAVVQHSHAAIDFRDSRTHEAASAGVHGITGSVVGTSDVQALTNKDLTDPTNTFPSSLATDAEVTTAVSNHAALTTGVHGVGAGVVVGTTEAQALTNKDLTDATNAFPASLVTATGVQTLTNKTIDLATTTYTGGSWLTWLPAGPGLNMGDGSVSGYYRQEGKTVFWQAQFVWGSQTTFSGNLSLNLPPAAAADATGFPVGRASIKDSSTSSRPYYTGTVVLNTSTQVIILLNDTNLVTPTTPMTWATGDALYISGSYRAA
jgi:hypothetical protein